MLTIMPPSSDTVTVASIGVIAYILGNLLHEGLGHAGACIITGGKAISVTAVAMDCSADNRLVTAGGTIMNAVAGLVFFLLGRIAGRPHLRYFLWLSMTINLMEAAGYFLFSGIGGIGDWEMFIQGFTPQWAWRVGLALIGGVTYALVIRFSLMELRPLIGSDPQQRVPLSSRLMLTPYFAGGIVECLAGVLNPQGWILVVLSAAASTFGGTSGLAWGSQWLRGNLVPPGPPSAPVAIDRSWPWICAAVLLSVAFIAALGPGIRF
jgi:hypothetical protein